MTIDPWGLPCLNTVILLTSGLNVTVAHLSLKEGRHSVAHRCMAFTILGGLQFSCIQWYEYETCCFTISDSVYGSIFYMLTGFHGIHVLVGTIFLYVCTVRHSRRQLFKKHHVGFVCAI
jgi:heme/copper-type cytochrome/quinol oxidase subunit 3